MLILDTNVPPQPIPNGHIIPKPKVEPELESELKSKSILTPLPNNQLSEPQFTKKSSQNGVSNNAVSAKRTNSRKITKNKPVSRVNNKPKVKKSNKHSDDLFTIQQPSLYFILLLLIRNFFKPKLFLT